MRIIRQYTQTTVNKRGNLDKTEHYLAQYPFTCANLKRIRPVVEVS